MIEISFRIGLFVAILGGILFALSFLPNQLPADVGTSIVVFVTAVNQFSYWLPIATLKAVLVLSIGFWGLLAFWDISNWLLVRFSR